MTKQDQARNLMKQHRWSDAIPLLEADIAASPEDPWSPMFLGSCHYELRDYRTALTWFETAGKLLPDDPTPLGLQGDVYHATGETEKARKCYQRALALDPEDSLAIKNWQRFLKLEGESDPGREYYRCLFEIDNTQRLLIWYSDDCDGVYRNASGVVPTFSSIKALDSFAEAAGLCLKKEDPILHDLDVVQAFVDSGDGVDCDQILAAWNLFGDVARSVGDDGAAFQESDQSLILIYEKIFHGCHSPVFTPKEEEISPSWSREEIDAMREHLKIGFSMFRRASGV